jgi:hypothetical protein
MRRLGSAFSPVWRLGFSLENARHGADPRGLVVFGLDGRCPARESPAEAPPLEGLRLRVPGLFATFRGKGNSSEVEAWKLASKDMGA